jgi:hypothetical protein
MVGIERNILLYFHLVDTLEYCQPVPHTGNSHFLQLIVSQRDKRLSDDTILCTREVSGALFYAESCGLTNL